MGIFGTLIGGSLGFFLGGPIGAVLGGVLGSNVDQSSGPVRTRVNSSRQAQALFAVALTSLAAKVAKADGKVTQDEIEAFDGFLQKAMGMSVEDRRAAAEVFNRARDSTTPTSEFSAQVKAMLRSQPDRLRDIVTILLMVAMADGQLHDAEEALIREIARDFGLSPADYQSCHATFFATTKHTDTDPYEVLGVASTATDAEVKSAHRRLVRDYHPDVIQSKGLPEDFTAFASNKLVAVNEAWGRVKTARGL
jgi:DnaJ like chaperone protein